MERIYRQFEEKVNAYRRRKARLYIAEEQAKKSKLYTDMDIEQYASYITNIDTKLVQILKECKEKKYGTTCGMMRDYVADREDMIDEYKLEYMTHTYPASYKMISPDMGCINDSFRICKIIAKKNEKDIEIETL